MHETTVRIRDEQHEWVQANEQFNLSGAVRNLLDAKMEADDD